MNSYKHFSIDGRIKPASPSSEHLRMGGRNPAGTVIDVNNRYLLKNNLPWLPVMGEMHFSRYPQQYWEESLRKMKAAGISIIASYFFWLHHEEIEGDWNWSGNCAYRDFVKFCAKHNLYVFPRIGPWAHGECRNGGFPDWLLEKCPEVRTDHPVYLAYVDKFYQQIFHQIEGFLFKDGGPIIGIQLENEYGHVGGKGNEQHIRTLKAMAARIGFDVPLYTVTGWGNAWVPEGEVLPLLGGYPSAPWTQHTQRLDPVTVHIFQGYANDTNIGSDLAVKTLRQTRYNPDLYPYFTCETGGGNQVTDHRRPLLSVKDMTTILLTQLGSGVNLPGYYVFHGGTNPVGKLSTFQESKDTGYPNDLPVLSYDFQAPIREYGQLHESYRHLKMYHLFLQDFGDKLAPMVPVFPDILPVGAADAETLRYVVRTIEGRGFIFVSNYQRHVAMPVHERTTLTVNLDDTDIVFPSFSIAPGVGFIWPFNLDLHGINLKYAQAQSVCRLDQDTETIYVFVATEGVPPVYCFDAASVSKVDSSGGKAVVTANDLSISGIVPGTDSLIRIESTHGKAVNLLTLSPAQAQNLWKGEIDYQQHLILTTADVRFDLGILTFCSANSTQVFSVYPVPAKDFKFQGRLLKGTLAGIFTKYTVTQPKHDIKIQVEKSTSEPYTWIISLPDDVFEGVNDVFLHMDVVCDKAFLYIAGELIADHFYNGEIWVVGLKRFQQRLQHNKLRLTLVPLKENADIYFDKLPSYKDGIPATLNKITAQPEYLYSI